MKRKNLSQTLIDSAYELGFDKLTIAKLEELNIPVVKELSPKEIKQIRLQLNASQGVFALYLNVTPSTIQKWEQGIVTPKSTALKLLNLIKSKGIEILVE